AVSSEARPIRNWAPFPPHPIRTTLITRWWSPSGRKWRSRVSGVMAVSFEGAARERKKHPAGAKPRGKLGTVGTAKATDDERNLGRVSVIGIVRGAEEGPAMAVAVDIADDVAVPGQDRCPID